MPPEGTPEEILLARIERATAGHEARARWLAIARPEQIAPPGDWDVWLVMAGRGWGKTRVGAEDINHYARTNPGCRIALVGATEADVFKTMIKGVSGILACSDRSFMPTFVKSEGGLVTWPNGSEAACFSAEEPERMRGPQYHRAWADELGAWRNQEEAWEQLMFGLRLGDNPQVLVTTTPRPTPVFRELYKSATTFRTVGKTEDNAANLSAKRLKQLRDKHGGTRRGRQELDGELLEDTPGALWTRAMLDAAQMHGSVPAMRRVVVGVDPSGSNGQTGDLIGIVAAGLGVDGRAYVLEDGSELLSPEGWARKAVSMYHRHRADRVVAERNFGGDMVAAVLRSAAPNLPVTLVTASRGKIVRAEPVAALYEQGKVSHAESFPELEDQLQEMTPRGFVGRGSPDRTDALVWCLTELMLAEEQEFDLAMWMRSVGSTQAEIEAALAQQAANQAALAESPSI